WGDFSHVLPGLVAHRTGRPPSNGFGRPPEGKGNKHETVECARSYFAAITLTAAVLTAATAAPCAITGSRCSCWNKALHATSTTGPGCALLPFIGVHADGLPCASTK